MLKKSELGKRHRCQACGTKFYDLNNPDAVCPKCGARPVDKPKRFVHSIKPVDLEMDPELMDTSDENVDVLSLDEIESEEEFADFV